MTDLKELYNEMERRKYNVRWIGLLGLGLGTYLFYGIITDWFTDQAADVTTKYLENEKFKRDILIFVEDTVSELVKSEKIQSDISYVLKQAVYELAETHEVQNKLAELFATVFLSDKIKNAGGELSEDVVYQLLHSDEYKQIRKDANDYIVSELIKIINDDEIQRNAGLASWNAFKVWFGGGPTYLPNNEYGDNDISEFNTIRELKEKT